MTSSQFPAAARRLLAASAVALGLATGAVQAQDLPGKGIKVQPLQSSIAEETFQTLLVSRALEKLGYDVQPIKEIEYATAYVAIASGDATLIAANWKPLHDDFYKNAGGDARLWRGGVYFDNALQGYLIDKKTADQYKITRLDQLKDPKIAQLFDTDGDGKADLTGCNPGWGCEATINHHLKAYQLEGTVRHQQGSYAALMADTVARFKAGKPVLYYTWTPYWVSGVLRPGHDVVWLQVPFSSLPGEQAGIDTRLPNGVNYGFTPNTEHVVVNRAFIDANPAVARLLEVMHIPVADVNAQNLRMRNGEASQAQIQRHADGWIKGHQQLFDGWIAQARAAAAK